MNKKILIAIVLSFLFVCSSSNKNLYEEMTGSISEEIEKIKLGGYKITVLFYDPVKNISVKYPEYSKPIPESEKLKYWKNYMSSATSFMFVAKKSKKVIKYFCVRGKIDKELKLELVSVDAKEYQIIDPNRENFENYIESKNILNVKGGYIFDKMELFNVEENKRFITEGLMFHGEFFVVTEYKDIIKAVTPLILNELKQKKI